MELRDVAVVCAKGAVGAEGKRSCTFEGKQTAEDMMTLRLISLA